MVRQHLLQHPDLARGVEVHLGGECIGRLDRLRTAARHRGGEGEEVDVVRVVRERIDAHRVLPFDEHLVGVDGVLVGLHGVVPPSDADVDVCGHVDHVPFARHELSEPLGARHRGLRVHRFDRVDVVMARAGVVRVARDDSLELAYDFIGAGVGSPVGLPVVPRAEVHQRFGIQGRGVEVVGVGVGDPLHRARVRRVQPGTIGRRDRLVALRDRLDVRALRRRGVGLERQRFLRRRVRGDSARRVHGSVDVRAVGECDPPVAHGAGGIEFCGARERADRFRVIESVDESQALVEVLLCGRDSSGDGFVVGAEVRVEGDRVRKALRRRGRHRRLCAPAGGGTGEQSSRGEPDDVGGRHGVPPSSLGRGMQLVGPLLKFA